MLHSNFCFEHIKIHFEKVIMSLKSLKNPSKVVNGMSLYYSGDVAVIVIDRGENRLNTEFCEALLDLLKEIERQDYYILRNRFP